MTKLTAAMAALFGMALLNPAYAAPKTVHAVYYELGHTQIAPTIAQLPEPLRVQALCLSMVVYREERGSSRRNQETVAQITINPVGKPEFAPTLCEVVHQINVYHGRRVVQYPWTVSHNRYQIKEPDAWIKSQNVAYSVLTAHDTVKTNALYFDQARLH